MTRLLVVSSRDFFTSRVIFSLQLLEIFPVAATGGNWTARLNDQTLLQQHWTEATIKMPTELSASGLNAMLLEWFEGLRQFRKIVLGIRLPTGNADGFAFPKMMQGIPPGSCEFQSEHTMSMTREDGNRLAIEKWVENDVLFVSFSARW